MSFPISKGAVFFRDIEIVDRLKAVAVSKEEDSLIVRLKNWAKKNPKIFQLLNHLTGVVIGVTAKEVIETLPDSAIILNIGSGVKAVHPHVINIDYDALPGVRVIADVNKLPFCDNSVDAIIAESVLEHVVNPEQVVTEIKRVLKPNGIIYIVVPFLLGYHSSPRDYYRWTHHGLTELLKDFVVDSYGPYWGPTTALISIVGGWLSLVLSLGSTYLYQFWTIFFMFALAPLTLLDLIIGKHHLAIHLSHGIYFVARKVK
ncbi:MAG: hypothetical protein A2653_03415 [Candidatus Zambryskibacteria bacterium RIFCSPHIGHO2_01_FULL_43_25]|uniref:Methyltransferase type 11 domain-containing protein n=1 Tax=Candidatus Zambryskibacteria bacterium RIFCSPLOWO2_01_FULL_45_21 TaxID=1802761 RepID=A0A1G2U3I1_9BACT|nr:MAG: hypothetical protein A2653_03415 [Candidatus Zambryskibacteria bacterium RIFCSPHIGHO2_01_FULL_43_25]OHB00185.1 MAG: hypothetical protein A3E94_01205 [Candidatus Zambryskibacteria bacterium RIFCSPHIGHO2_12_FULL_44_12b]OHB03450.1 MAG: hypothetical protein A3B14_02885 [Candidatus Zambryskibacteria bacterium RIFCSPLOWO2_01_FULL_45_21]